MCSRQHPPALRLLALALLAALGLGASEARACKPVLGDVIELSRPSWSEDEALTLVDERIEVECGPVHRNISRCHLHAVWVYAGPSGTPSTGQLALPSRNGGLQHLELRLDRVGVELEYGEPVNGDAQLVLRIPDSARFEVELEFETDVDTFADERCSWGSGFARHPQVSYKPKRLIVDLREPRPQVADRVGNTVLDIQPPPRWRTIIETAEPPPPREPEPEPEPEPRYPVKRHSDPHFPYRAILENRPVAHGPFIAGGVHFGPQIRARLRAGYEVAMPEFLLFSAAIEGDAVEELVVVPAIEVASPVFLIALPSAGIGFGAPIRTLPELAPGFRTQLSIGWPYVGLLGTIDVYPQRGARAAVRGGLMLQVSL